LIINDFTNYHSMKHTILFLLVFVCTQMATAQYYEIGGFVGLSNYTGDLSQQQLKRPAYNMAFGVLGRYNISEKWAVGASLTRGELEGSDANATRLGDRARNLSFRSDLLDVSIFGEYNLLPYHIRDEKKSAPYLFLGVSGFTFNPQAELNGTYHDLQPLRTEGQERGYSRFQVAIPFGIGFKFNINDRANFGLQIGYRKTFTDYLDDVSTTYTDISALRAEDPIAARLAYRTPEYMDQPMSNPVGEARGNEATKDAYLFLGATITVNLTDKYGLDFDEKYDVFKEEYEEYVAREKSKLGATYKKTRAKKRRKKKKQLENANMFHGAARKKTRKEIRAKRKELKALKAKREDFVKFRQEVKEMKEQQRKEIEAQNETKKSKKQKRKKRRKKK